MQFLADSRDDTVSFMCDIPCRLLEAPDPFQGSASAVAIREFLREIE